MNELSFQYLMQSYPFLGDIHCYENTLSYLGEEIDISRMNLKTFLEQNPLILEGMQSGRIMAKEFFDICKIEIMVLKQMNASQKNLEEMSSKIKNLQVIEKQDRDGNVKKYVYYRDENNIDHILYNYAATDVLSVYRDLMIKQNGNVTEKDLYDALERKMKEVSLTSSYLEEEKMNEELKAQIERHDQEYGGSYAKRNDEHEIIVKDGKVFTYQKDEQGNLLENKNTLNQNVASEKIEEEQNEISKVEQEITHKTILISEKEFYEMIERECTEEETEQRDLYYGFLFDLMTYEDVLPVDAIPFLEHYKYQMQLYELKAHDNTLTEYQRQALEKYYEMIQRLETQKSMNQETKVNQEEFVRTLKLPKAGFTNNLLLIVGTIVIGILLAFLLKK